jgi:hypothetical protein
MLRFLKASLGTLILRAAFTFILPPLVLAHEAHHVPAAVEAASAGDEAPFLRENEAAMTRMMDGMAAKPTGDIDRDFVAMMIPHHQGAIDMAVLELRYGRNEQLRRIAQEIIVDQMQEIAAMKLSIGEQVTTSLPAPTQPGSPPPAAGHDHIMTMSPDGQK